MSKVGRYTYTQESRAGKGGRPPRVRHEKNFDANNSFLNEGMKVRVTGHT